MGRTLIQPIYVLTGTVHTGNTYGSILPRPFFDITAVVARKLEKVKLIEALIYCSGQHNHDHRGPSMLYTVEMRTKSTSLDLAGDGTFPLTRMHIQLHPRHRQIGTDQKVL